MTEPIDPKKLGIVRHLLVKLERGEEHARQTLPLALADLFGSESRGELRASERQGGDPIQYYDIDGDPCSLDALCRKEPEWAASRIRHMASQPAPSADAAMARWAVEVLDAEGRRRGGAAWSPYPNQGRGTFGMFSVRGEFSSEDAARIAVANTLFAADDSLPAPPGGGK